MVSNSTLCWAISNGIPFKSLYIQANTSLNSFRSSINCSMTTGSSVKFTFTYYTFSLVPKLTLVSYSSLVTIELAMVRSCIHFRVGVSSMIISLTSKWKKVLGKCCLIVSSGIAKLTYKTHNIGSIGCFGTDSIILKFGMYTSLEIDLVWVGTAMVLTENKINFVVNIISSSSSNIPKWKS